MKTLYYIYQVITHPTAKRVIHAAGGTILRWGPGFLKGTYRP